MSERRPSGASTTPERRPAGLGPRRVREGRALLRGRESAGSRCGTTGGRTSTAMAAAIDDNTVLIVGSAPQYPQGVIDPIDRRSPRSPPRGTSTATSTPAWAASTLPYLARLGHADPAVELRASTASPRCRSTCTSSATPPRAPSRHPPSRPSACARYQTFVTDNWLGGLYGSSGVLGTKSGGPWLRPGRCCTTSATRATSA